MLGNFSLTTSHAISSRVSSSFFSSSNLPSLILVWKEHEDAIPLSVLPGLHLDLVWYGVVSRIRGRDLSSRSFASIVRYLWSCSFIFSVGFSPFTSRDIHPPF